MLAVALGAPAVRAARAERQRRAGLLAGPAPSGRAAGHLPGGGCGPAAALAAVADAVGGPLAGRLRCGGRVPLGSGTDLAGCRPADDRSTRWTGLVRAVARASRTGAPMAESVRRLAADEAERARWDALERARRAGVQAVGPLAACFLPAFVLLGVVPVVGVAGVADRHRVPRPARREPVHDLERTPVSRRSGVVHSCRVGAASTDRCRGLRSPDR